MLDDFREHPVETLGGIIERRKQRDAAWRPPLSVNLLDWMFLSDAKRRERFGAMAMRLFRVRRH
jgi:hypothetical protein